MGRERGFFLYTSLVIHFREIHRPSTVYDIKLLISFDYSNCETYKIKKIL